MHTPRSIGAFVALVVILLLPACGGAEPAAAPTPSPGVTEPAGPSPSPSIPTPSETTTSPSMTTPPPSGSPSTAATAAVEVFFPNGDLGDVCTEVFGVPRTVPVAAPLRGVLEALLAGPTATEEEQGYGGWFSTETADLLHDVRLEGSVAHLQFDASLPEVIPNASSSCGSSSLLAQLDRTTTQFVSVTEARYSLEGDEAAFYHWLQRDVP